MQQTSKIQKYTSKILLDPITGEVVPTRQTTIQEGDFNFHKIWWKNFVETTKEIGNKKIAVMMWLIFSAQKGTNRIYLTQQQIADGCGVSLRTVSSTIANLKESGFLKMAEGYILINPDVIFRGSYEKRMDAQREWHDLKIKEDYKKADKGQEEKEND